jgi:hypothetical protein
MSLFYYAYAEQSTEADITHARNINVFFLKLLEMEALVFAFYADEYTIDLEPGLIIK